MKTKKTENENEMKKMWKSLHYRRAAGSTHTAPPIKAEP
jgi:hypothetical protein